MHFTWEPSTSARVLVPVPTLLATLLATPNRGNHGGIAPTKIGELTPGKWILSNRLRSVVESLKPSFSCGPLNNYQPLRVI